jgi:hypothetical protein
MAAAVAQLFLVRAMHSVRSFPSLVVALIVLPYVSVIAADTEGRALSISIGGGVPGETHFRVRISDKTRSLEVAKKSLPFTKAGQLTETIRTIRLSKAALDRIFMLASQADDFSQSAPADFDGISASMELREGSRRTHRKCFSAPVWPVGPHTKALVEEIRKHLPRESRKEWP